MGKITITKVVLNAYNAVQFKNGKPEPMEYRREDLTRWANDAFQNDEFYFFADPIDPNQPCGVLKRCEPRTAYRIDAGKTKFESADELRDCIKYLNDNVDELIEHADTAFNSISSSISERIKRSKELVDLINANLEKMNMKSSVSDFKSGRNNRDIEPKI